MALPRTSASRGAAANRRAGSDYPKARCASCNDCNGTAKAFVHTIKRDCVRISPCPDANTPVHAPAISFDQSLQRGLLMCAKYLLFARTAFGSTGAERPEARLLRRWRRALSKTRNAACDAEADLGAKATRRLRDL